MICRSDPVINLYQNQSGGSVFQPYFHIYIRDSWLPFFQRLLHSMAHSGKGGIILHPKSGRITRSPGLVIRISRIACLISSS